MSIIEHSLTTVAAGEDHTDERYSVLIVEDDHDFAEELAEALKDHAIESEITDNLAGVGQKIKDLKIDLVLLDLRLGRTHIVGHLARLRSEVAVPIVVYSGSHSEYDRIVSLELGADDFLCKTISVPELIARLRARLRFMSKPSEPARIELPRQWTIDEHYRDVLQPDGSRVGLSNVEFKMFVCLAQSPGAMVSRAELCWKVFARQSLPNDRLIDLYIFKLRKKFGAAGFNNMISTVRGRGFLFIGFPQK